MTQRLAHYTWGTSCSNVFFHERKVQPRNISPRPDGWQKMFDNSFHQSQDFLGAVRFWWSTSCHTALAQPGFYTDTETNVYKYRIYELWLWGLFSPAPNPKLSSLVATRRNSFHLAGDIFNTTASYNLSPSCPACARKAKNWTIVEMHWLIAMIEWLIARSNDWIIEALNGKWLQDHGVEWVTDNLQSWWRGTMIEWFQVHILDVLSL